MDTPVIVTPRKPGGSIRVVGKAHGAINCVVVPADDYSGWFFQQFVSRVEMDDFIERHNLVLESNSDDSERGD